MSNAASGCGFTQTMRHVILTCCFDVLSLAALRPLLTRLSSPGLLLLSAGDHRSEAARSDPAGVCCSPLGQGPRSPPNPVLSAMLPGSVEWDPGGDSKAIGKIPAKGESLRGRWLAPGW